ncbi:hypothetical protein BJ741DRAFT_648331 [Chytriomyces cf. hyalinus JEL632]|nr:hypothetical protein BJ741DRAFT_648331 [Chytriomyces cf. hyalinus JEL632]
MSSTSLNVLSVLFPPRPTSLLAATATATVSALAASSTGTAANTTTPKSPTTTRRLNYATLAQWNSPEIAYLFLALTLLMTVCIFRNLIFKAKTIQTKTVYVYLCIWGLARAACFAMRGYIVTGSNGENYSLFQWANIVASLGFMPLAEAMAVITVEGFAIVFGFSKKLASRLDILVKALFITFGCCVAGSVMNFTLNRPFGSNMKDYTTDLVLREIGFNGLIVLTLFSGIGCSINLGYAVVTRRISTKLAVRFNLMMVVTILQSVLILVKLVYITYRNWNPQQLRDETAWYTISILPEYIFVMFYVSHFFARVFDDIYSEMKESAKIRDLEAGAGTTPDLRDDAVTPEVKDKPLSGFATPDLRDGGSRGGGSPVGVGGWFGEGVARVHAELPALPESGKQNSSA